MRSSSGGVGVAARSGYVECVGDRHAHVGVPEVRDRGAVAEADEAVHDRRRVDDHLDPLVRQAEEIVRLDHLEPLVGESGGVDGDLRAHRPGRMREGLLGRDVRELVGGEPTKRAAARGEDEALRLAVERALEDRRVLAVDRDQVALAAGSGLQRKVAGRDEALLVREGERDAVLERPHRRNQAGEADDGVQHDVRLGALEQLGRVSPGLSQRRQPVDRLRPRRRRHELELRMRVDHLDRLAPDRAGRAKQGDPLHSLSVAPGSRSTHPPVSISAEPNRHSS